MNKHYGPVNSAKYCSGVAANCYASERKVSPGPKTAINNCRRFEQMQAGDNQFDTYGELSKIFLPVNDDQEEQFNFEIYYYIPQHLRGKSNIKSLVCLHGGGKSTQTRIRSLTVIRESYFSDLKKIADAQDFALIFPSGSGKNWGRHLRKYLKTLNSKLRRELPVDPDRIGLGGHSMGAMGITRNAHVLGDEYAFILAIAGGMDPKLVQSKYLRRYFNLNYVHMVGKEDHFKEFVPHTQNQEQAVRLLEEELGQKSGYSAVYYEGGHNMPFPLTTQYIDFLFGSTVRDLAPKKLIGNLRGVNGQERLTSRYFWLEAVEYSKENTAIDLIAEVNENIVNIEIKEGVSILRVHLDCLPINLSNRFEVKINGRLVFKGSAYEIPDMYLDFEL
jgi:acetyl esterase/lipase